MELLVSLGAMERNGIDGLWATQMPCTCTANSFQIWLFESHTAVFESSDCATFSCYLLKNKAVLLSLSGDGEYTLLF